MDFFIPDMRELGCLWRKHTFLLPNLSFAPGVLWASSVFLCSVPSALLLSSGTAESMRPSHSHTLTCLLLCRWWSLTPPRSFCPMTARGSMPCLLLWRTRWLSRVDSSHPWSLFLARAPHPVLLRPCLSRSYLAHSSSGWAVCFTFRESHVLIIVFIPYSLKWNLVLFLIALLRGSGNHYYNVSVAYNEALYV